MPKQKKKSRTQQVADNRITKLADRLAILLVICNARDEDDWNPWALERTYDDPGSLGDSVRKMRDYNTAKMIVRRWIEKADKDLITELEKTNDEHERMERSRKNDRSAVGRRKR